MEQNELTISREQVTTKHGFLDPNKGIPRTEVLFGGSWIFENAGDEIPLHEHDFEQETTVRIGAVEVFDESGQVAMVLTPQSSPVIFAAGRKHGFRAIAAGTEVLNLSWIGVPPGFEVSESDSSRWRVQIDVVHVNAPALVETKRAAE